MCGIAGILGGEQGEAAKAQADEMIGAIAHRGPNGIRVDQVAGTTLAHARLSIIDLEGGWQPLTAAGSTIIGNGEIYNYIELAEEFGLEDKLSTGSDFEPLLHIYALEGEKAFQRLRGMYAFCLIGGDGRTWLIRDPFGIKPLYVAENRFASEPRALGPVTLSTTSAEELLALNYVLTSPLRTPSGAVIPLSIEGRGARGEGDRYAISGVTAEAPPAPARTPWGSHPHPRPLPLRGGGGLLDRLDAILEDSVRVHQRSDVPYGLFLSGGIDSNAIATLMARLNERPRHRLHLWVRRAWSPRRARRGGKGGAGAQPRLARDCLHRRRLLADRAGGGVGAGRSHHRLRLSAHI